MGDGKPLFAQIIKETLRSEDKWAAWADQSFTLIEDIQKAVPILRGKASVDEIKLIKRSLMEIGTAVAQASDEYGDDGAPEGIFGKILAKFSSCLLYTSDAADERSSVDLGGRRIIKKKNNER